MIRVLVVEDSLTTRKYIIDVLASDPEIEIVGEAADGKSAIELCQRLKPDVMTLDMILPVMTGLSVAEYVMAYCPTPILVVSSSTNRGELYRTYETLAAGAVDVLDKPNSDTANVEWERRLRSTVKLVSRVKVITHLRAKLGLSATPFPPSEMAPATGERSLVAIGASTGGPGAIINVLSQLPADFAAPILFVLHIGEPFAASFADWLDKQTPLRVRYAVDGEPLPSRGAGVIMAPPNAHLVVEHKRLRLNTGPERHSCRPSVDVLFESLAREHGPLTIAALLTGMGRDGAEGLLALRHAGAATYTQEEKSCVVYGMPREATRLNAASAALSLAELAARIASATRGRT